MSSQDRISKGYSPDDSLRIRGGIDPGKDGFFTVKIDRGVNYGSDYIFYSIPMIGTEVDLKGLNEIIEGILSLEPDNIHFCLEDVHAMYGSSAKGTFNFGWIKGVIQALLTANKIPYTLVKPKEWQKIAWQGITLQRKPSTTGKTMVNDTKKMSLMAAKRLFPDFDLRKSVKAKNPHDGKIDSLLICYYCDKKF